MIEYDWELLEHLISVMVFPEEWSKEEREEYIRDFRALWKERREQGDPPEED